MIPAVRSLKAASSAATSLIATNLTPGKKNGDLYRAIEQNVLDSRRQAASSWLKTECKGLIKELEGLFPTQANVLLQAAYPEAGMKISEAEAKIKAIDLDR